MIAAKGPSRLRQPEPHNAPQSTTRRQMSPASTRERRLLLLAAAFVRTAHLFSAPQEVMDSVSLTRADVGAESSDGAAFASAPAAATE